jgi:hypothetical protein
MTDTAYLYQYFLENSSGKKEPKQEAASEKKTKINSQEAKSSGKPAK